jgi:SAM-dependent methyltransferase
MRAEVVALLRCPVCRAGLADHGGALRCPAGHSFDVARQGYVSLLGAGRSDTGDNAAMVQARQGFLAAGHFAPLTGALIGASGAGPVVDLGAGTGHHTAAVVAAIGGVGLALDSSRAAARLAARAHADLGSVVADTWSALPVGDGVAGTVLTVFAPRNPAETARILAPGGRWVLATPTPDHLAELVVDLGLVTVDARKEERLATHLAGWELVEERLVERELDLSAAEVGAAVAMGPSAHHGTVEAGHPRRTRLSVLVRAYELSGSRSS